MDKKEVLNKITSIGVVPVSRITEWAQILEAAGARLPKEFNLKECVG